MGMAGLVLLAGGLTEGLRCFDPLEKKIRFHLHLFLDYEPDLTSHFALSVCFSWFTPSTSTFQVLSLYFLLKQMLLLCSSTSYLLICAPIFSCTIYVICLPHSSAHDRNHTFHCILHTPGISVGLYFPPPSAPLHMCSQLLISSLSSLYFGRS